MYDSIYESKSHTEFSQHENLLPLQLASLFESLPWERRNEVATSPHTSSLSCWFGGQGRGAKVVRQLLFELLSQLVQLKALWGWQMLRALNLSLSLRAYILLWSFPLWTPFL